MCVHMTDERRAELQTILDVHYAQAQDRFREYESQRLARRRAPKVIESHRAIEELTRKGMSARTVRDKLGLSLSSDQVSRIARQMVGPMGQGRNSFDNAISPTFMFYVVECLQSLGKDRYQCGICEARQTKPCIVHHTKYEGCTVYDLMYVCVSCNLSRVNKGLS